MNKDIKVILISDDLEQKNRASHNRNLAIEKMVGSVFDYELVVPRRTEKYFSSRIINGVIRRVKLIASIKVTLSNIDIKKDNVIFLRSLDPLMGLILWLLAKPSGTKLAIERNEFPSVFIRKRTNLFKIFFYKCCILSWHCRLFDVLFVMTDELFNFYNKYSKKGCIIKKLPMTVDFSRFQFEALPPHNSYICYAGGLSEKKDGLESLIKAFKILSQSYPDVNLIIAGGSNDGTREKKFRGIIKDYHLEDRVSLLGYVSRDDIPLLLCSAKVLVLPRPDSMQARGGFSTKLGEYLASGKPVIVTKIGEIPKYLADDEVYFISPDHIIDELVEKVQYILSNYEQATNCASRGKNAATKHFSLQSNQHIIKNAFEALFSH